MTMRLRLEGEGYVVLHGLTSRVVTTGDGVMRTASAAPDFGFWISDFGLIPASSPIRNPKPKIQNGEGRVPLPRHRAVGTAGAASARDHAARGKRRASVAAESDGRPQGTPSKEHSH